MSKVVCFSNKIFCIIVIFIIIRWFDSFKTLPCPASNKSLFLLYLLVQFFPSLPPPSHSPIIFKLMHSLSDHLPCAYYVRSYVYTIYY